MFTMEELEKFCMRLADGKNHENVTLEESLAYEALRVRKILQQYKNAEFVIREAFTEAYHEEGPLPSFKDPEEVRTILTDPALAETDSVADTATLISILLNSYIAQEGGIRSSYDALSEEERAEILEIRAGMPKPSPWERKLWPAESATQAAVRLIKTG